MNVKVLHGKRSSTTIETVCKQNRSREIEEVWKNCSAPRQIGPAKRLLINYNVPSSCPNKQLNEFHRVASRFVLLLLPSFAYVSHKFSSSQRNMRERAAKIFLL